MSSDTDYDFDDAPGVPDGEGMSIEEATAKTSETDTPHDLETEWYEYGLRATATRQFTKREVRCRIELDTWTSSEPRVSFRYRYPDADADVLGSWSGTATGRLSGPQTLRRWMELFDVFQAALDALLAEIASEGVRMEQAAVYQTRTDDPHPIFEVENRPERTTLENEGESA